MDIRFLPKMSYFLMMTTILSTEFVVHTGNLSSLIRSYICVSFLISFTTV